MFSYFQVTTSPRPVNEVVTKQTWLRRKKLFKAEVEVATLIEGCNVDPLMKPQMRSLQENLKLQPVLKLRNQIEVVTSSRGHDMELNWESQQRDLKLQLQEMENQK